MFRFDRTLLEPSLAALETEIAAAARAANNSGRGQLLRWQPNMLHPFLAHWQQDPTGWWQWNGCPTPLSEKSTQAKSRGRGHTREPAHRNEPEPLINHEKRTNQRQSAVAIVWWSDWIGRRHVRIVGCQRQLTQPAERLLRPDSVHPALTQVHPESTCFISRGGQPRIEVVCACGRFGDAAELAWMGDCCGPCHDRREAQDQPSPPPRILADHGSPITSLAFSTDRLLWLCCDGSLHLRDLCPDAETQLLQGPSEPAVQVRLRSDGMEAAVMTGQAVVVWDLAEETQRRIEFHQPLRALEYLPDGRLLAVTPRHVWDVHSGRSVMDFPLVAEGGFETVMAGAHGEMLVSGSVGGEATLWWPGLRLERRLRVEKGESSRRFIHLVGPVLAVSPDGGTLAVSVQEFMQSDRWVAIWDLEADLVRRLTAGWATSAVFSHDARTLFLHEADGKIHAHNVGAATALTALSEVRHPAWRGASQFTCQALSPEGAWLATGNSEGCVKLWPTAMFM